MSVKDLIDGILGPYGVVILLIAIGGTGVTRRWVFGWTYEQEHAEKEEWRAIALSLLRAGHRAIEIVEKAAGGD